jgi:adenosine deaminase
MDRLGELCTSGRESATYLWQVPNDEAVRDTFRSFVAAGVHFTIATDGPEMMHTHLRDELDLLLRIGALDERGLDEANRRGHDASFVRGRRVRV